MKSQAYDTNCIWQVFRRLGLTVRRSHDFRTGNEGATTKVEAR